LELKFQLALPKLPLDSSIFTGKFVEAPAYCCEGSSQLEDLLLILFALLLKFLISQEAYG
jgi:hypothetical protein